MREIVDRLLKGQFEYDEKSLDFSTPRVELLLGPDETVEGSFTIFGSSLFILYMMSTLYHAITPYGARKVFSIFNHICIYILIAGTYTPFILTRVHGSTEWVIFCLIWGLCIALAVLYAVFGARMRSFSVFSYVVLGWLFILVLGFIDPTDRISTVSQAFVIAGGVAYTVGGGFFLLRRYKWTHSIFHMFTLAGSILHFFAVLNLVR